jgi:alpha-1,6-mannosyltransferase
VQYAQIIVRAVLGLLNGAALVLYKNGLEESFGVDVGRWFVLLQASQFHVIYYASRTLPNMFAFVLSESYLTRYGIILIFLATLALREFLPTPRPDHALRTQRQTLGIMLLVFAGVIFRAEIALLLLTQLVYLLSRSRISLSTIISSGLRAALAALVLSVPLDSYMWQRPIWPELAGFYYNAIEGKSANWGTSPFLDYFTNLLPGLLNPLITMLLIPAALITTTTRNLSAGLVEPPAFFVALYSLQPHKEARFIIYVVPSLTAVAALSASYVWTRRSKSLLHRINSILLVITLLACFAASTFKLLISSLNYPGGEALSTLHGLLNKSPSLIPSADGVGSVRIHMDVLSCMTGVSRFQQYPSATLAGNWTLDPARAPIIGGIPTLITYDKTEESEELLEPLWWSTFDFALMEDPEEAIGLWETIGVVYAYAGIEFLRPGQESTISVEDAIYDANNSTTEDDKILDSHSIQEKAEELKGAKVVRKGLPSLGELRETVLRGHLSRYEIYKLAKDVIRSITGGWWIGPRMEPKISILKRVDVDLS